MPSYRRLLRSRRIRESISRIDEPFDESFVPSDSRSERGGSKRKLEEIPSPASRAMKALDASNDWIGYMCPHEM